MDARIDGGQWPRDRGTVTSRKLPDNGLILRHRKLPMTCLPDKLQSQPWKLCRSLSTHDRSLGVRGVRFPKGGGGPDVAKGSHSDHAPTGHGNVPRCGRGSLSNEPNQSLHGIL